MFLSLFPKNLNAAMRELILESPSQFLQKLLIRSEVFFLESYLYAFYFTNSIAEYNYNSVRI